MAVSPCASCLISWLESLAETYSEFFDFDLLLIDEFFKETPLSRDILATFGLLFILKMKRVTDYGPIRVYNQVMKSLIIMNFNRALSMHFKSRSDEIPRKYVQTDKTI